MNPLDVLKPLTGLLGQAGERVLDRFIPDPVERERAKLELHKAHFDAAVEAQRVQVAQAKVEAEDRDSARRMQSETRDWTPRIIALTSFFLLIGLIVITAFYEVPEGSIQVFYVLVSTVQAVIFAIVGYYFGSSLGSKNKEQIMATRLPPPAPPPTHPPAPDPNRPVEIPPDRAVKPFEELQNILEAKYADL